MLFRFAGPADCPGRTPASYRDGSDDGRRAPRDLAAPNDAIVELCLRLRDAAVLVRPTDNRLNLAPSLEDISEPQVLYQPADNRSTTSRRDSTFRSSTRPSGITVFPYQIKAFARCFFL
jgi:hypothetical protein